MMHDICKMKMKRMWLFRICLCLTLFIAANRIFAWTDLNLKTKYMLQIQSDLEEEEDDQDVLLPFHTENWEFNAPQNFLAKSLNRFETSIIKPFKLFIRLCNLRL